MRLFNLLPKSWRSNVSKSRTSPRREKRRAFLMMEEFERRDLMSASTFLPTLLHPVGNPPVSEASLQNILTTPVTDRLSDALRYSLRHKALTPAGPAFNVAPGDNTDNASRNVARAANGNFAVVWDGHDSDTGGVYVGLYDANGNLLLTEQVAGTDQNDTQATIAMSANGTFAIAWRHSADDPSVYVQRFGADGTSMGDLSVVVGTSSYHHAYNPSIALNDIGQLVVAYNEDRDDGSRAVGLWYQGGVDQPGIYFDPTFEGGPAFREQPSVALNNQGEIALAFSTHDHVTDRPTEMQVFALTTPSYFLGHIVPGSLQWAKTLQNTTAHKSLDPSVAINDSGTILVAYTEAFTSPKEKPLQGGIIADQVVVDRLAFGSAGAVTEQVLGPTDYPYSANQYRASVALSDDGSYVVTAKQELYQSFGPGEPTQIATSVVAQAFAADGTARSTVFNVDTVSDNPLVHTQDNPSVAVDGSGNFVVVYTDQPGNGGNEQQMARLFNFTNSVFLPGLPPITK
jgi:hypothetical protein